MAVASDFHMPGGRSIECCVHSLASSPAGGGPGVSTRALEPRDGDSCGFDVFLAICSLG